MPALPRPLHTVADYLEDEIGAGPLLLAATVAALIWANVAGASYQDVFAAELPYLDLHAWINDGAMALFFFVVGVEIKRELTTGELNDRRAAALPALAAVGGVVMPALIYLAITAGDAGAAAGWAIPAATDIAFAVGVVAVLGDRVPDGVRLVLLSIAIVDDLLAIAIIALFYSDGLQPEWLAAAAVGIAVVARWPRLLLPVGLLVWFAVHESGVHATIAGVALALAVPAGDLEERLHPLSALVVVPLFALANAGIEFAGAAVTSVTWGVAVGLVVGKLVGVLAAGRLALRTGVGALPEGVRGEHLRGVGVLAGIGFTVSLFIAGLAFDDPARVDAAKLGILAGSVISAVLGAAYLSAAAGSARPRRDAPAPRR